MDRDPELLTAEGAEQLRHDMDAFHVEDPGTFRQVNFVDLLGGMLNNGRSLTARHCTGHWLEVDSVQNLEYAEQSHRTLGKGSAGVTAGS